ncbi:MAG: TonB-dependent receptor, partial [Acidobacteriota bacterium]
MKKALKRSALFILALAVSAGWVFAQTGGAISGRVTDEAGQPVIGAVINVTGPSLQGTQGTVTDVSGNFHIPFIPQGSNYQIKVTAEGYNTVVRKGIDVPLNTTITVNFALSKGKTEIVVTGAAPLIDLKRDTVGANLSDNMIQSIPLPRNSAGIAYLAPSAVTSGLADTPSIGGASGPENQYTVNGIDITGAGDALNNFNLNFDFIQAYEVKTGGLGAEYGALMGGQINAITKSGGNEFHGGVFAYYWDDGLSPSYRRLNNPTIVDYNTSQKIYDIGGFLGGYIVKDKLWFFASYDYNKTQTNRSADGTDANVSLNGGPSYSWARATGVQNDTRDPQYAAKFTYNINSNHRLELSFFGNANRRNYYASLANIAQTASPRYGKTNNYAVNLQWNATWTPNFFTQISVGTRRTWINNHPSNQSAEDNYRYYYRYGSSTYGGYQIIPQGTPNSYDAASHHIDLSSWMASLGGGVDADTKDYNDQINVKFTNLFDAAGHHELSYGMQYYDITYDYNFNYTGPGVTNKSPDLYDLYTYNFVPNPFYGLTSPGGAVVRWEYNPGAQTNTGYLYRAQYFMNDQAKKTSQKYYGYWIQDNWNITDYFMLKLGARLDQIHMKGGGNNINVPNVLAPGQGYATGQPRTFDVNDELAPRIGFTWDVAHNGKSKLYGFYGQYYERVPNDMAIRALTDEYFMFEYYEDPGLTIPASPVPAVYGYPKEFSYVLGLHPTQIVGGPTGQSIKGSYNNEWILGYEYEVAPNFRLGARAIYRDLGRIIEDLSFDGGQTYIVTNPGNWAGTWSYGQRNGVVGLYTFPRPVRIY